MIVGLNKNIYRIKPIGIAYPLPKIWFKNSAYKMGTCLNENIQIHHFIRNRHNSMFLNRIKIQAVASI